MTTPPDDDIQRLIKAAVEKERDRCLRCVENFANSTMSVKDLHSSISGEYTSSLDLRKGKRREFVKSILCAHDDNTPQGKETWLAAAREAKRIGLYAKSTYERDIVKFLRNMKRVEPGE
jgi:hypothetical protein